MEEKSPKNDIVQVNNSSLAITDNSKLAEEIKKAESIQDLLPLFNVSIAKKQAMRILKREDILDKVADKIEERLDKCPDNITVVELNSIDKTMSDQKQKELGIVTNINDFPAITLNQQNNNVTVNVNGLSRESNQRVLDAVKEMLKIAKEEKQVDNVEQ